jgi:hypothetical protein
MLINSAFLRDGFSLPSNLRERTRQKNTRDLTVRSLISVDFPAPLGPTTPTRLRDRQLLKPVQILELTLKEIMRSSHYRD